MWLHVLNQIVSVREGHVRVLHGFSMNVCVEFSLKGRYHEALIVTNGVQKKLLLT